MILLTEIKHEQDDHREYQIVWSAGFRKIVVYYQFVMSFIFFCFPSMWLFAYIDM